MSSNEVSMDDKNMVIGVVLDTEWLFEGFQMTKGSELVSRMARFFESNPDFNETGYDEKIAQLAGTSVSNVNLLKMFYGDWPTYADVVGFSNQTIPMLGHPTQSRAFLPVFIVLTVVTMIVVALRMYSRLTITGFVRSYDYVLLAGFFMTLGFGLQNAVILNTHTFNRGVWDKNWIDFQVEQDSSLSASILYPLTVLVIKFSLLLFYYKLSVWHPLRWATIGTALFVIANTIATIFGWAFQCNPTLPWKHQNYMNPDGECPVDTWKLEIATGSINIITDVVIWLIPMPMIWKMQLSLRERIISVFTLGVGALACIACAIRLRNINMAWYGSPIESSASIICIWTITELYLAQICASIPAIRALVLNKAPHLLGSEPSERKENKFDQFENYDQFPDFSSHSSLGKASPDVSVVRQDQYEARAENKV
ncbi:hypothetical protein H072_1400 [Dactylellina haptotyla CBS 200.50]|uniref:Rhodopsin domain-containing protein n=1 Tax=Dactylellina haptotyla (strain CBS 200.50) TaxID=1284197 RepID=S8AP33_DACHA|nr:hypothetical protein H072_1400 [Dactylellina haptotyla CBS 200.50]